LDENGNSTWSILYNIFKNHNILNQYVTTCEAAEKFQSKVKRSAKKESLGGMFAVGNRKAYDKKPIGPYVSKTGYFPEDIQEFNNQWHQMAVSVERLTALFFGFIKKEAAELIMKYDMEKFVVASNEPNSVVSAFFTRGYATKSHTDNDEMKYGYGLVLETGKVIGGDFVLPEYKIRLKLENNAWWFWKSIEDIHGTAVFLEGGENRYAFAVALARRLVNAAKKEMSK
jgi:hypothetical protein